MPRTLILSGHTSHRYETGGGFMALMHESHLPKWNAERDNDRTFDRNDWLWSLADDGIPALIVGGEPAMAWWQYVDGALGVLFQWIYGPHGYEPPKEITLEEKDRLQAPVEWRCNGDLWLFDSAMDGLLAWELLEGLSIKLRDCRCVETYEYKPTEDVFLVAHVFVGEKT